MLNNTSHVSTPEVTSGWLEVAPVAASLQLPFAAPMTPQHGSGLSVRGTSVVFGGGIDGTCFAGVRAVEMDLPQDSTDRKRTYAVVDGTRVSTTWPPI